MDFTGPPESPWVGGFRRARLLYWQSDPDLLSSQRLGQIMPSVKRLILDWRVKSLIQATLGAVPGGRWTNNKLQTLLGDLRDFEDNVGRKVDDWVGLISYLQAVQRNNLAERPLLEIGPGWYPTLPLCFVLAGVERIYTVDLTRHLNEPLTFRMLSALEPQLGRIASLSGQTETAVRDRYAQLRQCNGAEQLLAAANVHYYAPQDAAKLDSIASGSLDLVYSNSVFEHVFPQAIPGLLRESWRVLKPDGLIMHAVACNDHFAHFDKRISFVNYLRYTEQQWRWWNSSLNYQNRLRAPDFIRMTQDNGFRILHEARAVRPGTREALATMLVAPQFSGYSSDDLAATTVDFVAAKVVQEY
jgi:SAM-dependent methyltransferase